MAPRAFCSREGDFLAVFDVLPAGVKAVVIDLHQLVVLPKQGMSFS